MAELENLICLLEHLYQEILKAATARHIQVIPSLDMPGHSRAAMKAMTARYNKYQALEDEEYFSDGRQETQELHISNYCSSRCIT